MSWLALLFWVSIAFANLEDLIKQELQKRFGEDVKLVKLRPLGKLGKVEGLSLDVEYGRLRSVAYVDSQGERVEVVLDLLWRLKVYRAKADIPKDSPLDPSMFEEDYIWVKTVPSDLRILPDSLSNYVSSTKILKGSMLRRVYLRPVPAVRYSETVRAVFKSGSVVITFNARALDTGYVGKVIRIKPEFSDKVLRARVVSRGEVEVLP